MARVQVSEPTVTLSVCSEPSSRADGALTVDSLLDLAKTLADQPVPDGTPLLCTHGREGHLTDLWLQVDVLVSALQPADGPAEVETDPAGARPCPAPDCGHAGDQHASTRDDNMSGCSECGCPRSRERVLKLTRPSGD